MTAGQTPRLLAQPAGSVEDPAAGPAPWAGVISQGITELMGRCCAAMGAEDTFNLIARIGYFMLSINACSPGTWSR
jgi:hypothetical protein